ncbi:MAG: T9SS type A sorting domain-containing protein [Gemmatimonadota bacterium]|nr:MAG: T9SS type A sorting domain-containing protein [Gemmatimonadota bacterium]
MREQRMLISLLLCLFLALPCIISADTTMRLKPADGQNTPAAQQRVRSQNDILPELHLFAAAGCERCSLDANHIFIKPDTLHRVCVFIDNISFELDIETLHFMLTWDAAIQFTNPSGPSLTCTDYDSMGWDIKYHIFPDGGSGEDSLEVWLIISGDALQPLSEPGCVLNIDFQTYADLTPGSQDTIHFEFATFNEGGAIATFDFYKTINRPPVITWQGQDAPDTIDAIYLQECTYYEFLADAHDYDIDCYNPEGDTVLLWAQTDDPCPWSEGATFCGRSPSGGPPYVIPPFIGAGYVQALFKFHPPKLGICDDFWVNWIAMSTHTTGQPLYDTLSIHFIVEDCAYQLAWMTPPPRWDDPDENEPLPSTPPYYEVYACQNIEVPVGLHFDYDYLLDDPIWSVYFEVDYDNRMEIFEIGNEGLITEHLGVFQYNIIADHTPDEGKVIVSMAFNNPLQWPPWPMPPDPLNPPFGFVVCDWYKLFYVGFHIPDYLPDSTLLKLTIHENQLKVNEEEYKMCSIPLSYLHVRDFSVNGSVKYSDTCIPVPGVTISTIDTCGGTAGSIVITDNTGAFQSKSWPGCSNFCLEPSMEPVRDVWRQVVTSYDATLILRSLCGMVPLTHNDSLAADITGDGTISAFDASVMIKWLVTSYTGSDLIPTENIGTWIFESIECGDCGLGPWGPECFCLEEITQNETACYEAVVVGDVSQNWPGPSSAKVVENGLDISISDNTITIRFIEPVSAVDMALTFDHHLSVADVSAADGITEWMARANELSLAAASASELGEIRITFEKSAPAEIEIVARANENLILTTAMHAAPLPAHFSLAQNFPNPFNPTTTITYQLPTESNVTLTLFNTVGQHVRTLVQGIQEPGCHKQHWDGRDESGRNVPTGIYFYRLTAARTSPEHRVDFSQTKRMILIK